MTNARDPTPHCSKCSFDLLEALYQINVEAKRYAEAATDAYNHGLKAKARHYSLRKEALYSYKKSILATFVDQGCVDTICLHEIDNREYYCLYVGEFSFHSPVDEWDDLRVENLPSSPEVLGSFDTAADSRSDQLSERKALARLNDEFGTPNDHLSTPFVDYDYRPEFAGWSYLPGAIEEGDRVDNQFGRNSGEDFLFNVGDEFETQNGHCRIRDRYEAWLTPLWDRSPIYPRPVYDIDLDGEPREAVRQRRLVDDWSILAESLHDPLPNVKGKQAELARNAYDQQLEFDIGDIVEVDPSWDDGGTYFHQIEEAHLSYSLLMCDLKPVGPTEHGECLSIEEFADDVVAIHDSPPKK